MKKIKNICVFCGSSSGNKIIYSEKAVLLGNLLARENISLVYGGSNIGLMGVLADSVLQAGGEVIGVIPQKIVDIEIAHKELTQVHIVQSMDERKGLMVELSDAFIAMPGGYGTLDELFEVLSLNQLNYIQKPCGIFNIDGYFDHLLMYLERSMHDNFIRPMHHKMLIVDQNENELLKKIQSFEFEQSDKWWLK